MGIGRQLTVVFSFFLVGAITGLNITPGKGENIFGIKDSAQEFLNYGFHGAVITTILASITWQLAASAFPIAFLNILLMIALFLEFTGLCSGAWVCARLLKAAFRYQYDEVYVGTPEERLKRKTGGKPISPTSTQGVGGGWDGHSVGSPDALDEPANHSQVADDTA